MRTRGNLDEGLGLDATYAATVSLRNDLRFLFQTIGALVRGTGS
jgi:lipopolysaccharide/colanic/teichoic acid biosynthesis glycosyltransferase